MVHIYAVVKIALLAVIAAAAISGLGLYRASSAAQREESLLLMQAEKDQLLIQMLILERFKGKTQTTQDWAIVPERRKL